MDLQRIKILAEDRRIEFKALARAIGMSEGNLHRCVKENKIQAQNLEKIAVELRVSVLEFFDENTKTEIREAGRDYVEKGKIVHKGNEYSGDYSEADLRDQIAQLKSQLADKERIIKLMEEKI